MQDNSTSLIGGCCAKEFSPGGHPEKEENTVKETWSKPQVTEQEVGLEVTSYVAAEIDPA
jgi:coenzyme PQQ precursor peptide PqqA